MSLLDTLTHKGKAILITGLQGSGKTLLAKALAEGMSRTRGYCVLDEEQISRPFGLSDLEGEPAAAILNLSAASHPNAHRHLGDLKHLAVGGNISIDTRGQGSVTITLPTFIFVGASGEEYDLSGDRRFLHIHLGGTL